MRIAGARRRGYICPSATAAPIASAASPEGSEYDCGSNCSRAGASTMVSNGRGRRNTSFRSSAADEDAERGPQAAATETAAAQDAVGTEVPDEPVEVRDHECKREHRGDLAARGVDREIQLPVEPPERVEELDHRRRSCRQKKKATAAATITYAAYSTGRSRRLTSDQRSPSTMPSQTSSMHQGIVPSAENRVKRQSRIRETPAGIEMIERTIGTTRAMNTAKSPYRANQRSATSRSCASIRT